MRLSSCRLCLLAVIAAHVATLPTVNGFSASSVPFQKQPSSSNQGKSEEEGAIQQEEDKAPDDFIFRHFNNVATDIDDNLCPPSLKVILQNIRQLTHQGSDIRGRVVDHPRVGRISRVTKAIEQQQDQKNDGIPALTPFAAFCLGHAFGKMVLQQHGERSDQDDDKPITIAVGRDPRAHGSMLCDAFARGMQSVDNNIRVVYTGVATTPSMFHFCRAGLCDGAVMVTASHLPEDRNGFKLFTRTQGGFTRHHIQQMNQLAADFCQEWHDLQGMLPPTSGGEGVFCSEWVDFMPHYAASLRSAICKEVAPEEDFNQKPLEGLKIVLNAGHGSGGFFNQVLEDLGADVSASVHVEPNAKFPAGIPNPEKKQMIDDTVAICEQVGADLGILLDTDADRSGFIVPVGNGSYQPLNRNRLIALLSVIFSRTSPGCAIVTDSVTSEGLADFLEEDLGLQHVRYLKGYANVIGKAQELTENGSANAEMAIETSGHCAMKENGYLDDGTYTAVKVIGLLAREKLANNNKNNKQHSTNLLELISAMKEMPEEAEVRMNAADGSLETMERVFELASRSIESLCETSSSLSWTLDTDNLEGIRVRTGNGGFFMLRKSLHDPLVSLQIEALSKKEARDNVVRPLLDAWLADESISSFLETQNLADY